MQFIDLKKQYHAYKKNIDESIANVLKHGRYIMGPEIQELEVKLAEYVGAAHCISVGSGTVSLEIALRAMDVGPGDEVITVPFTWISTAEVILAVGAKPVFVDIEAESYNMNPELLESAITDKTKAIMPVSLFGQMPKIEIINKIAEKYDLPVIEDAAQSFGATRHGNISCGATTIGSTSFFPAKVFGCYGDGGAIFTNNEGLANSMKAIRNHGGISRGNHTLVGVNGRFDTLQAAVLLAKFPYFETELEARRNIGARYSHILKDYCSTPKISEGNSHVYAQYTLRLRDRDKVVNALKSSNIPTAIHYEKCLHEQPVFKSLLYKYGDFPEAEKASREVLSLPMHPFLSEEEQDDITLNIINIFKNLNAY